MTDLTKDVLDRIIDKVEDIQDIPKDCTDCAFTLWERENIDGTVTYCTYDAKQWIAEHFLDLGDFVEEYNDSTGTSLNPFKNPESFMVIMLIEITNYILSAIWEDGITKEKLLEKLENYA